MIRPRSQTIGAIGRAPARHGRTPSIQPPIEPPPPEPSGLRHWVRGAFLDNVVLKFLSLVLAMTVFLVVDDDKDPDITVRVPVAYIDPDDKVPVADRLNEVHVKLHGPWRRLRRFDERELGRIVLDLRNAPNGEIPFTSDMVHAPAGLSVGVISPSSIRVFDKRAEKLVEVFPAVTGRPRHGYIVLEIKPSPATAKVRGAEKTLGALSSVRTRGISLDGRTESFTVPTQLVPPDGIELVGGDQVSVHVLVDEELVTRKLPDVLVAVKGEGIDPAKWTVTPIRIEVTLTGTLLAVEKARETMSLVAPLSPLDKTAREVEVMVVGLPPGVGHRRSPERVRVAPVPPAR